MTREDAVFVVPDLTLDGRFRDLPFVKDKVHARFYVGVPIISPSGLAIGSLSCLHDDTRAGLTAIETTFLQDVVSIFLEC